MDRIDRRGFLECMAWTGSALVWTSTGGVLSSRMVRPAEAAEDAAGSFSFVQISDTHIGFKGQANSDPAATLAAAARSDQRATAGAGVRPAHRRPDARAEAGRVRHASPRCSRA